MKKFVTTVFLICAAILLVSPPAGFAYSTWSNGGQGGCKTCHPEGTFPSATLPQLHAAPTHIANCNNCHTGTTAVGTVSPSKCIVCHPVGGPGLCPLINAPAHTSIQSTCSSLECHPSCVPANTTTTAPVVTTTTVPANTTTTTPVPTNCITIEPNEVTVDGILNKDVDITATFTRTDLIDQGLTQADLEKLVVSTGAACLNYITVNSSSVNYDIGNTAITATIPITVKGNAPSTSCLISVTDPQGIATPPINCEATFTITSTNEGCEIKSISPSFVRIGLGIIPRIKKITITLNKDLEAAGITGDDLSFGQLTGAQILNVQVSGDQIIAQVLFWGTKPGTYNVDLGQCGSIPFVVKRF